MSDTPPERLTERDWEILLSRIKKGKCTPFLGAGACYGTLLAGKEIAKEWAREVNYPFEGSDDLARVAQFMAGRYDPMYAKERMIEKFIEGRGPPAFSEQDELHAVLDRVFAPRRLCAGGPL